MTPYKRLEACEARQWAEMRRANGAVTQDEKALVTLLEMIEEMEREVVEEADALLEPLAPSPEEGRDLDPWV